MNSYNDKILVRFERKRNILYQRLTAPIDSTVPTFFFLKLMFG